MHSHSRFIGQPLNIGTATTTTTTTTAAQDSKEEGRRKQCK